MAEWSRHQTPFSASWAWGFRSPGGGVGSNPTSDILAFHSCRVQILQPLKLNHNLLLRQQHWILSFLPVTVRTSPFLSQCGLDVFLCLPFLPPSLLSFSFFLSSCWYLRCLWISIWNNSNSNMDLKCRSYNVDEVKVLSSCFQYFNCSESVSGRRFERSFFHPSLCVPPSPLHRWLRRSQQRGLRNIEE